MKVSDLVKELNLTVFCGEAGLDAEISGGYTSDLLSDVMGHIDEKGKEEDVPLLGTPLSAFEVTGKIYSLLQQA